MVPQRAQHGPGGGEEAAPSVQERQLAVPTEEGLADLVARPPNEVGVDPVARGKGIGVALLSSCLDTMKTQTKDLPENAQRYVLRVEELIGARVSAIGVGPGRAQIIERHPLLDA